METLGGRHTQAPLVQAAPAVGQSVRVRHWTHALFTQYAVLPWQVWQEAPQCAAVDVVSTHAPSHRFCPVAQLVAHMGIPSARQPNVQAVEVGIEQAPEPLHVAAGVAWLLVQVAAAHVVLLPGNTQAVRLVPLHAPAHAPVPPHGVRCVVTAVHVPRLLAFEHDSHCPVHAALQQTPSAHTPLAHTLPAVQASPSGRPTHVPLLQTGRFPLQPPQHSVIGMQLPLQSFVVPVQPEVPPAPPPLVPPRPAAPPAAPPVAPAPLAPPRPAEPAVPPAPPPETPAVPGPPVPETPPALPPAPAGAPVPPVLLPPPPLVPPTPPRPAVPASDPPVPAPPPPRPDEPAVSGTAASRLPPPPSVGLNGGGVPHAASAQAARVKRRRDE